MKSIRIVAALVATAALAAPAPASAHITLQPNTAPAGGYTRLDVRVPNERDDAATTKIQLRLPDGFVVASYEPVPGWTVQVDKTKLDQPIKTDDGEITEQVSTITWTGHGAQGRIPPGAFRDFGLSLKIPGTAGDELTFKALQTYSSGEIVRWIGPEDSDTPAPRVMVEAAATQDGHAAADAAPAPAQAASTTTSDDSGSDTLSVVALIVGALGLLAGGAALLAARRSAPRGTAPSEESGDCCGSHFLTGSARRGIDP